MIEQIKMPQLGESVTEGTITQWLVKVGDKINKYEPLAEVSTDKVNSEIPALFSGTVAEILCNDGDTLPIGTVICTIETEEVGTPTIKESKLDAPVQTLERQEAPTPKEKNPNSARYSPAVMRLAQENNIDLTQLEGSGIGGRITRKDVEKVIQSGNVPSKPAKAEPLMVSAPIVQALQAVQPSAPVKTEISTAVGDIEIPVTQTRRAIATNMLRSKQEAPHAWMMIEVDVTNLVSYRDSVKNSFKEQEGFNVTYFAFFAKAVAQALKKFPQMNSMWAGDKIIQKKDINLSIAVATDSALYVPVIRNADEKTVKGIAREINELAAKVRSGKLKMEDMQGGTFTVNNTGSFGSIQSMGIINHPQAAILQVESIVKRPVIINGMIAVRDMVNLCLSLDHRVLDGLVCGQFLAHLKSILENMSKDNTPIY